jgi:predicted small lipoprotein YifL
MNSVRLSAMSLCVPTKRASKLVRIAVALALVGVLGGCGVRGSLDPPPDAKASGTAVSPEAADPGKDSAVKNKPPFKPFILDGLIR